MNKKQFNRYEVILRTIDGSLTIEDAAASLTLSARQVKRIKKEVISDGPAALIHKNSLRTPHNALPNDVVQQIISLKTSDMFANCNFTHFNEILEESYDINISYSTLYSILKNHGKENTVQEVRKALQANIEAIQRATKLLEKQSDTLTSVMKQKLRELEESKNSFFRYEGLKLYLFWGGMVCNILVFLMLASSMFGR